MEIGFDPAKNAENIRRRGLSFEVVRSLEWDAALIKEDRRRDYGEQRIQALVYGDGKPHVVVYTMRGPIWWIISFQRAREAERRLYEHEARPLHGR